MTRDADAATDDAADDAATDDADDAADAAAAAADAATAGLDLRCEGWAIKNWLVGALLRRGDMSMLQGDLLALYVGRLSQRHGDGCVTEVRSRATPARAALGELVQGGILTARQHTAADGDSYDGVGEDDFADFADGWAAWEGWINDSAEDVDGRVLILNHELWKAEGRRMRRLRRAEEEAAAGAAAAGDPPPPVHRQAALIELRMVNNQPGFDDTNQPAAAFRRAFSALQVTFFEGRHLQGGWAAWGPAHQAGEEEEEAGAADEAAADEAAAAARAAAAAAAAGAGGQAQTHVVQVARGEVPVNEFEHNDALIFGLYPLDFPLRGGLMSVATMSLRPRQHLLRQFHQGYARHSLLVFLLANQVQRHSHAQAVSFRAKNDPAHFEALMRLVNHEDFEAKLARASEDPNTREAKELFREIQPHLVACSAAVPFSAMARNQDVTRMYSMWRAFGMPSGFFTLSPDDHNPLTLRLTYRTVKPGFFPESDEGWRAALQNGEEMFGLDVEITGAALAAQLVGNPVAAAEAYNRLMVAVWRFLLGLEPQHLGGVGSKKSAAARHKGLFGTPLGACGANEEQSRTALHQHILFWGGVTPDVISANLQFAESALRPILESMFKAQVSVEVHIADILRLATRTAMTRHGYGEPVAPGAEGFDLHAEMVAVQCNVHRHAFTCWCAPAPARSSRTAALRLRPGARVWMPFPLAAFESLDGWALSLLFFFLSCGLWAAQRP